MADFKQSLSKALAFEFSSSKNALHKNGNETGYTFCGIYETANPDWKGWSIIKPIIRKMKTLTEASVYCYSYKELMNMVDELYMTRYWTPYRLGELTQQAANEIFVFGVNAGMPTAIKKAQEVAGVSVDGKIGSKTIKAINAIPEKDFDWKFDDVEIKYYTSLSEAKPVLKQYLKGWTNRAKAV